MYLVGFWCVVTKVVFILYVLLFIRTQSRERDVVPHMVVGSIPHGGFIELFLVPASAPRLVLQSSSYVLFCLWDEAYKITLAADRKEYRWQVSSFAICVVIYHMSDAI